MADKMLRSKEPKMADGVKQPGEMTQIDGATYPEAQGKSSKLWTENTPPKKGGFVKG